MSKSRETFSKKEHEKKKQQKRKEKEQRKEERRAGTKAGSWEEMIAYVDENGNITATPPDPNKKKIIRTEDISIGIQRQTVSDQANTVRKGKVTFFNSSKGFGFIKDIETGESVFVHNNSLTVPIKENDAVTFETEKGFKGPVAVRIKLGHS
jgi:cold shock CspA family protein